MTFNAPAAPARRRWGCRYATGEKSVRLSGSTQRREAPLSRRLLRRGRLTALPVRRGAAAVEFAVVLPLLMFFTLGIIEYGRLVMVQQILSGASREGVRLAVADTATTSQVASQVNSYLASARVPNASVTVSPSPPSSAADGTPVTVTVSIPFSQVAWLPPLFNLGTTLQSTSVMRRDRGN